MVRCYARAPKGPRAYGGVPRTLKARTPRWLVRSRLGIGVAMVFEGATTRAVFETCVEGVLDPVLKPGPIVVMDILGAHKGERIDEPNRPNLIS